MYGSDGRWGGRLTGRPLPENDAEIDELSDVQRHELAGVWLGRAASERRVADAFQVIHEALEERGSASELRKLAARAVDDEHRHAELSRVVASRFAGGELDPPARLTLVVPEHPGAAPELVASLRILGHCALNETFASVFLETSLKLARGKLAMAALRELLSDEVDHARIGWAHLAELDAADRACIAPWLLPLVRANLKMWRDTPRPYPVDRALHRHGAPPADAVEEALLGALRHLIIPGFDRFSLPTGALVEWLWRGAAT
jgi:hypothetical protein